MKKLFSISLLLCCFILQSQVLNNKDIYTRQDSLRGTNNEYRTWWNVLHYDLDFEPNYENKSIKGSNKIRFEVLENQSNSILQIDLQEPMKIDEIKLNNQEFKNYEREGNVYFLKIESIKKGENELKIYFSGNPTIAKKAPWDGGWIFGKDAKNREWMSVACQGLGASVWFPDKDFLGDEPEEGAKIQITVPKDLTAVSNGKLTEIKDLGDKNKFVWEVKNPINNYNIIPQIGHYVSFTEEYEGENGKLDLSYWVLDYNLNKAKNHFKQVPKMINCFEHWFGAYPFYEDSYKLIEAPYLGMEHQSGVAYGNHYINGYVGNDLSFSGWGLKWDFMIIHESGHEWFGNNITNKDIADMWIHEGFTSYSEALFTECLFGKEAGSDYVIGTRANISNDKNLIGDYGVNQEGSGDIYFKGANMIHTLRQWINDDELFRNILRGLNKEFYHKTVSTQQIEDYISKESNLDLKAFFNQYLRTTQIPLLEYKIEANKIHYRWANVVQGFAMPLKLYEKEEWIYPTTNWKTETWNSKDLNNFKIDRNFYIDVNMIEN